MDRITGLHHLTFSMGLKASRMKATDEIERVLNALGLPLKGITFYATEYSQFADVEIDDWQLYTTIE